jgi:hypothetical protein
MSHESSPPRLRPKTPRATGIAMTDQHLVSCPACRGEGSSGLREDCHGTKEHTCQFCKCSARPGTVPAIWVAVWRRENPGESLWWGCNPPRRPCPRCGNSALYGRLCGFMNGERRVQCGGAPYAQDFEARETSCE